MKWRSKDGNWQVEDITLALTGDGRDGHWLRLRYRGYFVAECRTVAELARYVDISELEDALRASSTAALGSTWVLLDGYLIQRGLIGLTGSNPNIDSGGPALLEVRSPLAAGPGARGPRALSVGQAQGHHQQQCDQHGGE